MVSWRCPHCGTPQLEAARCWVCHRSTTSCSSCRHFREAVAKKLGYCALDRQRQALTGAEERPCWVPSARERFRDSGSTSVSVAPWNEPEPEMEPEFGGEIDPDEAELSPAAMFAPQPVYTADDLWSLYLAGPSPAYERRREPADTTIRSAGMWVETNRSGPAMPPPQPPLTARHRNVRSVRHRPWGPVPGREDAYVRSLRIPEKVRRPGV